MGKTKILLVIAGLLIVALCTGAGFFAAQFIGGQQGKTQEQETQRLVAKVSKLYAVPTDEEPTVAEIKNKDKLKEQEFFRQAENGDYLLVYNNAKLALIYRESQNKLMSAGPITPSQ